MQREPETDTPPAVDNDLLGSYSKILQSAGGGAAPSPPEQPPVPPAVDRTLLADYKNIIRDRQARDATLQFWAQENPEKARDLISHENPSRKDFSRAGIPIRADETQRAIISSQLRGMTERGGPLWLPETWEEAPDTVVGRILRHDLKQFENRSFWDVTWNRLKYEATRTPSERLTEDTYVGQQAMSFTTAVIDFIPSKIKGARSNAKKLMDYALGDDHKWARRALALMPGTRVFFMENETFDRWLDASGNLRADAKQWLSESAAKHGFAPQVVAGLTDSVFETVLNLQAYSAMGAAYGGTGGLHGAKYMQALRTVGRAVVRSTFNTATTEQMSMRDALKSFGLTTAYMMTPAASGWWKNTAAVIATDIGLNVGISATQTKGLLKDMRALAQHESQGNKPKEDELYALYATLGLTQMFGSDVVFGATTRAFKSAPPPRTVLDAIKEGWAEGEKAAANMPDRPMPEPAELREARESRQAAGVRFEGPVGDSIIRGDGGRAAGEVEVRTLDDLAKDLGVTRDIVERMPDEAIEQLMGDPAARNQLRDDLMRKPLGPVREFEKMVEAARAETEKESEPVRRTPEPEKHPEAPAPEKPRITGKKVADVEKPALEIKGQTEAEIKAERDEANAKARAEAAAKAKEAAEASRLSKGRAATRDLLDQGKLFEVKGETGELFAPKSAQAMAEAKEKAAAAKPEKIAGPKVVEPLLTPEESAKRPAGSVFKTMVGGQERWAVVTASSEGGRGGHELYPSREEAVAVGARQIDVIASRKAEADREAAAKAEADKAESELKDYFAPFMGDRPPMEQGRLRTTLTKSTALRSSSKDKTYSGPAYKVADEMLKDGYVPEAEQVKAIKDPSRTRVNRMDNREQSDFARRQREAGMKTEYRMTDPKDSSSFVVSKAFHDYARFMADAEKPTPVEAPAMPKNKGVKTPAVPASEGVTPSQRQAITILDAEYGGDSWGLAGPKNRRARAAFMSKLLGRRATQAESGITAIKAALMKIAGIGEDSGTEAERDAALKAWIASNATRTRPDASAPVDIDKPVNHSMRDVPESQRWKSKTPREDPTTHKLATLQGVWRVVPEGSLLTSNDKGYDMGMQNRDREKNLRSDEQVLKIQREPDLERLGGSVLSDMGAPIVLPSMAVLSGNGRATGLRMAYAAGNADAYRAFVLAECERMGLDASGIDRPVLVRELRDSGKTTLRWAAELSNRPHTLERTPAEIAVADASLIDRGGFMDLWNPGEDGSIRVAQNWEFLSRFVDATGSASLFKSDGTLNPSVEKRVRDAMLAAILGRNEEGRALARIAIESGDEYGMLRILDGVTTAGGALIKQAKAKPQYDILPPLSEAIRETMDFRRQVNAGTLKDGNLEQYLNQGEMFTKRDPIVAALMRGLDNNKRSAKGVREYLESIERTVAKEDTSTASMFGEETASRSLLAIVRGVEKDQETDLLTRYQTGHSLGDDDAGIRESVTSIFGDMGGGVWTPQKTQGKSGDIGFWRAPDGTVIRVGYGDVKGPSEGPRAGQPGMARAEETGSGEYRITIDPERGTITSPAHEVAEVIGILAGRGLSDAYRAQMQKIFGDDVLTPEGWHRLASEMERPEGRAAIADRLKASPVAAQNGFRGFVNKVIDTVNKLFGTSIQKLSDGGWGKFAEGFRDMDVLSQVSKMAQGKMAGRENRLMTSEARKEFNSVLQRGDKGNDPLPERGTAEDDKAWLARNPESAERLQAMVEEAAKDAGYDAHRFTTSSTGFRDVPWMLFADNKEKVGNGYGKHHFVALSKDATPVESIKVEIEKALRDHGDDAYTRANAAALADEANPKDIVDSAGIWDMPDAVQVIWDRVLYPNDILSIKTSDGLIVFTPDQIKSADLITRDDQGRIIPLSERFNAKNDDIRFQSDESEREGTGLRESVAAKDRDAAGMDPEVKAEARRFEELKDNARAAFARDSKTGSRLVDSLADAARPLTDSEVAVLTVEKVHRDNARTDAFKRWERAITPEDKAEAAERIKAADASYEEFMDVLARGENMSITMTARGLSAIRMMIDDRYELVSMKQRLRAAQKGGALTPEQEKKLTALADQYKAESAEKSKRISELEAAINKDEADVWAAAAWNRLAAETEMRQREPQTFGKRLEKTGDKWIDETKSFLKDAFSPSRVGSGVPDPMILAHVVKWGAGHILRGVGKWTDLALAEFGEKVRPYLQEAAVRAQIMVDEEARLRGRGDGKKPPATPEKAPEGSDERPAGDDPVKIIKALYRLEVEGGVDKLEPAVVNVHQKFRDMFPKLAGDMTKEQVRDLFSDYGKQGKENKDPVTRILLDLRRQAQLEASIERVMKKLRPLKTGKRRGQQSHKVRTLTKELNRLMKEAGISVRDPETQLASALTAAKTRMRNRLEDLNKAMDAHTRIPLNERGIEYDAEANRLRQEVIETKARYDEMFPKIPLTPEQRLSVAVKQAERTLEQRNKLLKDARSGKFDKETPAELPYSAKLQSLREQAQLAKAELEMLRELADPGGAAVRAKTKRTEALIAKYERMLETGDFSKQPRNIVDISNDPAALAASKRLAEVRGQVARAEADAKWKAMRTPEKVWEVAQQLIEATRRIMPSSDFSGLGRQLGPLLAGHPVIWSKSVAPTLRAYSTEYSQARYEKLMSHPVVTSGLLSRAGVRLFEGDGTGNFGRMDDTPASRIADKVPNVKRSARAFATGMNEARLNLFVHLLATSEDPGDTSTAKLKDIGNLVNDITGSANIGRIDTRTAGNFFWAPRWVGAGVKMSSGASWWLLKTPEARKQGRNEFARMWVSTAATLTAYAITQILQDPERKFSIGTDRDEPDYLTMQVGDETIEINPTSSRFLQMRLGNHWIPAPFMNVIGQYITFAARIGAGEMKVSSGRRIPLIKGHMPFATQEMKDEGVPQWSGGLGEVFTNMLASKRHPGLGVLWQLRTGEDFFGDKVPAAKTIAGGVLPLALSQVARMFKSEEGMELAWLSVLTLIGIAPRADFDAPAIVRAINDEKGFHLKAGSIMWAGTAPSSTPYQRERALKYIQGLTDEEITQSMAAYGGRINKSGRRMFSDETRRNRMSALRGLRARGE